MLLTLTLLLGTLVVSGLVLTALLPTRVALWVGSAVNAVQLHSIALLGIYPSLALLSWLALWRTVLKSSLWRWGWMRALLVLGVVQAASLSWAPLPMLGVRHLIYLLPLPLTAHAMYRLTSEDPALAMKCLRLLLIGSIVPAALVVLFRLLPALELAFLHQPLAQLFVSPNTLAALFDAGRNNVLDPAKSGGVFVNANIASTYLGICAVAAWYVGRATGSTALRAVAIADWLAVCFTGSKAGLICALAVPASLALIGVIRGRQANPVSLFAVTVGTALGVIVLLLPLGQMALQNYQYEALATFGSREDIWKFALQMLQQHPFTGLGFGGWERRFQLPALTQGVAVSIPPHNSLFILWLQSGLPGLLAGLALIVAIYAAITRALGASRSGLQPLAMASAGAFSWYLIQGMGENFGLVGEIHMTPLIGALLGHLCACHDGATVPYEHTIQSLRRAAAAPALQAV